MGPIVECASSAGYEHDGGRAFAPALHVDLSSPADTDLAREFLVVLAEFALAQDALGGVAGARSSGERRGGHTQHHGHHSRQHQHHLLRHTISKPLEGGQVAVLRLHAPPAVHATRHQRTLPIGSAYRQNELDLH